MGLPWVRLETSLPTNHKILALVEDRAWRAIAGYTFGLAHCGAQGTDGFITRAALPFVHATASDANRLVDAGLWHLAAEGGGFNVNGWADFQATSDEIEMRSNKARYAAEVRWKRDRAEGMRDTK